MRIIMIFCNSTQGLARMSAGMKSVGLSHLVLCDYGLPDVT